MFFTSDVFAVGAILACREQGIAVPERMGIAGFHDLEIGRVVSPTLTTVHVPAMEMGRKAGRDDPGAARRQAGARQRRNWGSA